MIDLELPIGRTQIEAEVEARKLINEVYVMATPLLNKMITARIRVWAIANRNIAERNHNRLILTKAGGILLGHGLDMLKKAFDDLCLATKAQWDKRWMDYAD